MTIEQSKQILEKKLDEIQASLNGKDPNYEDFVSGFSSLTKEELESVLSLTLMIISVKC